MRFDPLGFLRGYRKVERVAELGNGRVELEGLVEAIVSLIDPTSGEACVALEYHAAPPSGLSLQGPGLSSRAFTVSASQAVDFVISDGAERVLVRVNEHQDDVAAMHSHLMQEYGLQLRVQVLRVRAGDMVRVRGNAGPLELPEASPYRSLAYAGVIRAERFWLVESD